jgi:hypothetical protein
MKLTLLFNRKTSMQNNAIGISTGLIVLLRRPIHVRVWLASPAQRGTGLGLISPHTYERGDAHMDEFGSLEPEPSRTREPDSYVYGPP